MSHAGTLTVRSRERVRGAPVIMSSCSRSIRRTSHRYCHGSAAHVHESCCAPSCDACLDVIRLAVVMGDQHAWRELHRRYYRHVSGWCRQAAANATVDVEELVSLTWQRFWRYFTPEKL